MHAHHLNLLKATRSNIAKLVEGLSIEQLNHIPEGFNNNLAWNIGHILVTQELLIYRLSNQTGLIADEWIAAYRKGTKPESPVTEALMQSFLEELDRTIQQMHIDFDKHLFKDFKPYPTSYGITLNSVEDALIFNNLHESMHLGTMIALKKLV
ncbi:MAG: DinB family protein [Bacteroidota bacterium]